MGKVLEELVALYSFDFFPTFLHYPGRDFLNFPVQPGGIGIGSFQ
jgi:hypothetical protein